MALSEFYQRLFFETSSKFFEVIKITDEEVHSELLGFIKGRLFDRLLGSSEPDINSKGNIGNYDNSKRKELPVLASWTTPFLEKNGYVEGFSFDILGVFQANQIQSEKPGFFGDRLLRDVCANVINFFQQEVGIGDFFLIRVGGDEFKLMVKEGVNLAEDIFSRLQTQLSKSFHLTFSGGGEVLQPLVINQKDRVQGLRSQRKDNFEGSFEDITKRIERLKRIPTIASLLSKTNITLEENPLLLEILEAILIDSLLERKIITDDEYKESQINVFRDVEDFFDFLFNKKDDVVLIRAEAPGVLKKINDNQGYEKGDEFIMFFFDYIAKRLIREGIRNFSVFRRGGDFYIALSKNDLGEKKDAILEGLSKSKITQEQEREGILFFIFTPVDLNFDFDNEEKSRQNFYQSFEGLSLKAWKETIRAFKDYFFGANRDLPFKDWQFLADFFNPYDKRGLVRLYKLLADRDIQIETIISVLSNCYLTENRNLNQDFSVLQLFKDLMRIIFDF